ncbi:MAG: O-antigen ligase family protein [Rhodospirillales bacterium]|nr:MAG: O-antigen ligase family protein [Rhodospirillales bacterium]
MHRLETVSRYGFWAVLALAPLPLGSNRDWAWSPLAVVVGLLLVARAAAAWRGDDGAPALDPRRLWLPIACLLVVSAWALAQTVAWTPSGWHSGLYGAAGEALGAAPAGRVSIDPELTQAALMRLLTYAGMFWLALGVCRDPADARRTLRVAVAAAAGYALYGLLNEFATGSRFALWYERPFAHVRRLSAVFINADNYATYAGLGFTAALAGFLPRLLGRLDEASSRRLAVRAALDHAIGAGAPWLFAATLTFGTLLMTGSRAGLAATVVAAFVVVAGALAIRRQSRTTAVAVSVAVLATVALCLALVGDRLFAALDAAYLETAFEARARLYREASAALAAAPWTGWGFGTYIHVFPLFQGVDQPIPFEKAHSVHLENAIDLGVPMAVVLTLMVAAPVLRCVHGAWTRRRDQHFALLAVAAGVLTGLHAVVDFGLQIPGIAVVFAALLGMGVAQSWSSRLTEA